MGSINSELNPRTTHFEFSGPSGAFAISSGLPFLVFLLYFSCNANGCPANVKSLFNQLKSASWSSYESLGVYLTWSISLMILDICLPGKHVPGTTLRTGDKLSYKFNGTNVILLLSVILVFRSWQTSFQLPELQYIYDHLLEFTSASLLVAVSFSTYLYIISFKRTSDGKEKLLALGGNSGNVVYDWFIGRELNPRWGPLDLKSFLEMRPGLLSWILIDLAMVHHQWLKYGQVSWSIILVTLFQSYYVIEGTFYEEGLVSMIDTTTDGLGFMLVFGDICLVPFTYSLQARYLADHPVKSSWIAVLAIISVYVGGILIFRLANNEKNGFRANDPKYSHSKYITSKSGSKLLVTGWWGKARHINYFGDWLSAWASCLPCGLNPIPYYFMAYFAASLIHRNERDEAKCSSKYGETWEEYKRKVPYKFIPYVY